MIGAPIYYQAGDIFLVSGQGFFSKGIKFFTRDKGEKDDQVVTHGGAIVSDGVFETATVVEALGHGVVQRGLAEAIGKQAFAVYRPLNLEPDDIKVGVAFAISNVKRGYGWLKIGTQVLDWAIPYRDKNNHPPYVFRRLTGSPRFPFCTFLVDGFVCSMMANKLRRQMGGVIMKADIEPFGVPQACCDPDTIKDFSDRYPDIYKCVRSLGPS